MELKKIGRPKKLNAAALQRIRDVIDARRALNLRIGEARQAEKDMNVPLVVSDFAPVPNNAELAAELGMSLTTLRTGIDEVLHE